MTTANSASTLTKYLIGTLTVLVLAGGGAWVRSVEWRVAQTEQRQGTIDQVTTKQAEDIAVIREKVRNLEETMKEIRQDVRNQSEKLDELLKRTR